MKIDYKPYLEDYLSNIINDSIYFQREGALSSLVIIAEYPYFIKRIASIIKDLKFGELGEDLDETEFSRYLVKDVLLSDLFDEFNHQFLGYHCGLKDIVSMD